ncbi:protein TOXD [Colletotrichum liriopes]|uniref:Protein TOXD n=1 Tax=Colletotrichum liriopes TaxID=708192 RepID=A0AA37GT54_9PEZI|nr:protein TOXD [Colletotrichum liriopes]
MRAIHIEGRGKAVITENTIPKLRDGHILVRPRAVAVQPSDWKHVDYMLVGDPTGARMGFEYAGNVIDIGKHVSQDFRKGDRVFGLCHASNALDKENGTFADFAVVRSEFQMKIPEHLDYVEAAALSSGLVPVCQGLYQDLSLPLPTRPASAPIIKLLIYGGSTASGIMGIQFSKLSNCRVVATCSPHNFTYLKSLGVDHCVDYRSETCVDEIRAFVGDELLYAWDCIATVQSARICAAAMSRSKGGHYSSLLFLNGTILKKMNPKIQCTTTIGYTIFGEKFHKETVIESRLEDYKFWMEFWAMCERLIWEGEIRPPPQIVNMGGESLEGVLFGMQHLKMGKVSAGKLVYTM